MKLKADIEALLAKFATEQGSGLRPELSRPDEEFGDYSTNLAMQLAGKTGGSPREIAEKLVAKIKGVDGVDKDRVKIAGPGFINICMTHQALMEQARMATQLPKPNNGQEILVEFGDPNPFKEMHIGHAYSYIVGDAISSLLEASGATVRRLSYHGDVGLHVAKAIWGLKNAGIDPSEVGDADKFDIGRYYAAGAQAYDKDAQAKTEIEEINKQVYTRSYPEISKLYEWGRQNSLAYFERLLNTLEVKNPRQFFEDLAAKKGEELVRSNVGKVFEESDSAIVYKGEKVGLHTRVFITSKGLPTYEAKDLGLAELKKETYPSASQSLIITAHEQVDYFKVMLAALAEIDKKTAEITKHLYHGFVSLSSGKMSSRTGEVYGAAKLIIDVDMAVEKAFGKESISNRNAAIKYGFLKHRLGSDIVYDVAESISLEGNSGPYLQYAHARAKNILAKAGKSAEERSDLQDGERSLARKISEYPDVVAEAIKDLAPSHICSYLYELAQNFNHFYETNRVIGDEREGQRLGLVEAYAKVLAHGLGLLNIEAPEKV